MCFICFEEEFNIPPTGCCGQTAHTRCIVRWMRTRTQTAIQCPACRVQYPLPSEEETAGDERIMSRLRQFCTERHPGLEVDRGCIACVYYATGLNPLQRHDFAFNIRRIAACMSAVCHGNPDCRHCSRLVRQLSHYYG